MAFITKGAPAVWQYLTLLVVVPLISTVALGGAVVVEKVREVGDSTAAQHQLRASEQLDAVRRAVDRELLPRLALDVARDDAATRRAGIDDTNGTRTLLLRHGAQASMVAQRATDAALAAVTEASAGAAVRRAASQLGVARRAAGEGTLGAETMAWCYLEISNDLLAAEHAEAVRAGASGLTERSAIAVDDLGRIVDLMGLASRQLPLAFTASVTTGTTRENVTDQWRATSGTLAYQSAGTTSFSNGLLRTAWAGVVQDPITAQVTAELSAPDLLTRAAPGALGPAALLELRDTSAHRDDAYAVVLHAAVDAADSAAAKDRSRAQRALALAAALCLIALALSLVCTAIIARQLTSSLGDLSAAAQRVQEGARVVLLERGPREVRVAAHALSRASAGLHLVRRQAEAAARGDLRAALAAPAVPGRLGEVIHSSVTSMLRAVEARDALRAELAHRASHDPLTGLANRAAALAELEATLSRARRHGTTAAVLFIDLDGFKQVNDTLGHACGDVVLQAVASRLAAQVRARDVVARLGGDEFIVIVNDIDVDAAISLGTRLVAAVSVPLDLESASDALPVGADAPCVGASVGVALTEDIDKAARLLERADAAAYRAKSLGRGRVVVFDEQLLREQQQRREQESDLREAVLGDLLEVRWEPVADATTGQLAAWHALPHWERLGSAALQGDALLTVAEGARCGREIGRGLLRDAAGQAQQWRRTGAGSQCATGSPSLVVGISDRHAADPRLPEDVSDALIRSDLPPGALAVAFSDGAVNNSTAEWNLRVLSAMGVRTLLVGAGSTPVRHLVNLPVHAVAVDADLDGDDSSATRRVALVLEQTAQSLGLPVLVAGVTTPQQLERARRAGAQLVLGPLIGEPVTAVSAAMALEPPRARQELGLDIASFDDV